MNFDTLQLIDGILPRLYAVYPERTKPYVTQWVLRQPVKSSSEDELLIRAHCHFGKFSDLPPGGTFDKEEGLWFSYSTNEYVTEQPPPCTTDFVAIREPKGNEVLHVLSWQALQCLSALRAMLLALMDTCGECARDPDYVGRLSSDDSLTVLDTLGRLDILEFVSFCKYWKDWPTARFLHNELPVVPQSWSRLGLSPMSPVFSGETGVYFRRLAMHSDHSDNPMAYYRAVTSIAQSKRAFAVVPSQFVVESYRKHSSVLSSPPSTEISVKELEEFRAFCRVFFSRFRINGDYAQLVRASEPSRNASVESGRNMGGSYGYIQRLNVDITPSASHVNALDYEPIDYHRVSHITVTSPDNPLDELRVGGVRDPLLSQPLVNMSEVRPGQVQIRRGLEPKTVQQIRGLADAIDDEVLKDSISSTLDSEPKQMPYTALLKLRPDVSQFPLCRAVAVLEPLKVRIITAMPAVESYLCMPFQAALWDYFRTFPCFALIGEPFSPSHIYDLQSRDRLLRGDSQPRTKIVSGDFRSATDLLDYRFSEIAADEAIRAGLPKDSSEFETVLRNNLGPHVILYPHTSGVNPVLMENGQLMGANLSFTILCLINFFGYLKSLGDPWPLTNFSFFKVAPVIINGDDIGFFATDVQYHRWTTYTPRLGLFPSQGKNFFHERFGVLNSQPFEVIRSSFRDVIRRLRHDLLRTPWPDMDESPPPSLRYLENIVVNFGTYSNIGLLTGQSKLTGRASLSDRPLSDWYKISVVESMNPVHSHKRFLFYHRKAIEKATFVGHGLTLNLFAHLQLGGLGFEVPHGLDPHFDDFQRRLATLMAANAEIVTDYEDGVSPDLFPTVYFLKSEKDQSLLDIESMSVRHVPVIPYRKSTIFPFLGEGPLPEDLQDLEPFTPLPTRIPKGSEPWVPSLPPTLKPTHRLSKEASRILRRELGEEGEQVVPRYPIDLMTIPVISRLLSKYAVPLTWYPKSMSITMVPATSVPPVLEDWETDTPVLNIDLVPDDERVEDPFSHLRRDPTLPSIRVHPGKGRRYLSRLLAEQSHGFGAKGSAWE